jgi:hypothetical protein
MPAPWSSVERYYEWQQARFLALSKGFFSLAGLILSPLLAAILSNSDRVDTATGLRFCVSAGAAAAIGLLLHWAAGDVAEEFRMVADQPAAAAVPE